MSEHQPLSARGSTVDHADPSRSTFLRRHVLRGRRPQALVAGVAALSLIGFALPDNPAGAALVQAVPPTLSSSTQFDITGFLEDAQLDTACVAAAGATLDAQGNPQAAHCGGTATINGHHIVIPAETIVILPAAALTWEELFDRAPAPYTGVATGMALNDQPKPLTTYEVQVVGNRVIQGGQDRMIAGLVHVSQQDLNGGVGYINWIDYTTGEIEVGGQIGVAGTGARVRINDPIVADSNGDNVPDTGRYGRPDPNADIRFQVDQDNPTILAETGFPMCIPRVTADPNLPGNADDPLCPRTNRPISTGVSDTLGAHPPAGQFDTLFRMNLPGSPSLDPTIQAPFEIGDFVNFSGSLVADGGRDGGYISAHTIVASLGIYTQPGVDPAYVTVDVSLLGTGGLTVFGAGEAAIRTRFEGMSTDETRTIHVYGVDMNPADGSTSDRDYGTIVPDPGPPLGAVRGRWRLRPPCTVNVPTQKNCTPPPAGTYLSPPREVRAVIEGLQQFNADGTVNPASQVPGTPNATTYANGIYAGQYHAPVGEYIFPENVPGSPVPENNFNTIEFLAFGGYTSVSGVVAGVLNPWPSNVPAPARVCATPTVIGSPYAVANGGTVQLSGSVNANATSPIQLQWTAGTTPGGTDLNAKLTNATTTAPTFNASGLAAGTYHVTFTAKNACGSQSVPGTVVVSAVPPPTISPIANQTVNANTLVTITATSTSTPAPKFTWTQTGGPAALALTQTPSAATATASSNIKFTPVTAGTYTFSVTANNVNGTSPATTVTVVVNPVAVNNITFTAEYRTGKQRLVITAVTTDLTVTSMTLKPYMTESGTMFDPATLGAAQLTNGGGGNWTLTAVGALPPACKLGGAYATPCSKTPLVLVSAGGAAGPGTSSPTALTRIRI